MNIVQLKGREAPRAKRSAMETMVFTRSDVLTWKVPPFQRPVRVNDKVLSVAEEMRRETGAATIPGVITLGRLGNDKTFYIVDGQHRLKSFDISEKEECIADVRLCSYESMADMADDFVELNGKLVNMRPDDILRGLEESLPQLRRIRTSCDFVTYGQINRNTTQSAVIGMSQLLRCWQISSTEVPGRSTPSATVLARGLDVDDADRIIIFMNTTRSAWGTDPENYRLWGSLNLSITMWLWRQIVVSKRATIKRATVLNADQFRKCLMSVSADGDYVEWLVGRQIGERDRSPCYSRLRGIFARRLTSEGVTKVMLPTPNWASKSRETYKA